MGESFNHSVVHADEHLWTGPDDLPLTHIRPAEIGVDMTIQVMDSAAWVPYTLKGNADMSVAWRGANGSHIGEGIGMHLGTDPNFGGQVGVDRLSRCGAQFD
jgi:hypothetical protein